MRSRPSSLLPTMILAAGLAAPHGMSQTAVPDANGRLVFKANARIVVLDVVVSDHDGQPVSGLRKEDFAVTEDGRAQQITSFEEHRAGQAVPTPLPPLPPNIFTNIPRVKPVDAVTVLLLDSLNTPIENQSFVRAEMLKYLKTAPAGRRIAIFTLGTRLRYVQGFTDDPAVLAAVLSGIKDAADPRSSALLPSNSENDANQQATEVLYQNFAANPSTVNLESLQSVQQFQAEQATFKTDERVHLTLEAFDQLSRYLAGIPGRKNVIWFSGAFPLNLFPNPDLQDSFVTERKYERQVQRTDGLLSAAEVAIYPVAAEGNSTDTMYNADQSFHGKIDMQEAAETAASHPGQPQTQPFGQQAQNMQIASLQKDSVQRNADHTTMDVIAADTGGQAFYNSNGINSAVARVLDRGSRFYTLTYTPANPATDAHYRKISVKVAPPASGGGYKLAYRRGYFAPDARAVEVAETKPGSDPLHPFMGPGMPSSTQIIFALRVKTGSATTSLDASPQVVNHPTPVTDQFGRVTMEDHREIQPTFDDGASGHAGDNPKVRGKLTRYTVDFVIAARGLQLDEIPNGGRHGSIESTLIAYDRDGRPLNWLVRQIDLTMNAAQYAVVRENGVNFRLALDVPKDAVSIRSGIYDLESSLAGTFEFPITNLLIGQAPSLQAR